MATAISGSQVEQNSLVEGILCASMHLEGFYTSHPISCMFKNFFINILLLSLTMLNAKPYYINSVVIKVLFESVISY